jgi:hypothetical protein
MVLNSIRFTFILDQAARRRVGWTTLRTNSALRGSGSLGLSESTLGVG